MINFFNKKNTIYALIYFFTGIIIFNFYYFVIENSNAQYSDWLINYQGGFVRRGLIGEIFFQIYKFSLIRLDIIVFFFVSLFYIFFAINLIKLLNEIKFSYLNLLIIFSPLSFFYPVMEQKVSGRKDILFLFLFSVIANYLPKIKYEYQKYIIILVVTFLTLSHTGFIFFTPFFIVLFWITNEKVKFKKLIFDTLIVLFFSFFAFLLVFSNSSIDLNGVSKICNAIKPYLINCGQTDYISTLNWSLEYNLERKKIEWIRDNYTQFYVYSFIFCFTPLAFALKNYKFKNNKIKIKPLAFFFFLIIFTLPIYYAGVDYGRYLYISYVGLLILYFKCLSKKIILERSYFSISIRNTKIRNFLIISSIILYGLTWTVPHCCGNKFKFNYAKPLGKLAEKLN